jgi:hypothetical protein
LVYSDVSVTLLAAITNCRGTLPDWWGRPLHQRRPSPALSALKNPEHAKHPTLFMEIKKRNKQQTESHSKTGPACSSVDNASSTCCSHTSRILKSFKFFESVHPEKQTTSTPFPAENHAAPVPSWVCAAVQVPLQRHRPWVRCAFVAQALADPHTPPAFLRTCHTCLSRLRNTRCACPGPSGHPSGGTITCVGSKMLHTDNPEPLGLFLFQQVP